MGEVRGALGRRGWEGILMYYCTPGCPVIAPSEGAYLLTEARMHIACKVKYIPRKYFVCHKYGATFLRVDFIFVFL